MTAWLNKNFNILTADVSDENFIRGSQSEGNTPYNSPKSSLMPLLWLE